MPPKKEAFNSWHLFMKEKKTGLSVLGDIWRNMNEIDKKIYKNMADNNRDIYRRAMLDYEKGEYIDDEVIIYTGN